MRNILTRYQLGFMVLLVAMLSFFAVRPLFVPGFFPMHDDTQVVRIHQMAQALSDGQFPVRFIEGLGYGYGYPLFHFYSPLPYYVGGIIALISGNALMATKATFLLAIVLSGIGMYIFIKNFLGMSAGLVSAVSYIYFPYHAVNTYVRGDMGELYVYALLPFFWLSMYKVYYAIQQKKHVVFWVLSASATIAGIVLSHNLSAFMLFLYIGIFIVSGLFYTSQKRIFTLFMGLILFLGFLLSAFYAVPAILEMNKTNVLSQVGGGSHYADHFVCVQQLWQSDWGYGGSAKGCIDGMSFRLGKLHVLFAFGSVIALFWAIRKKKLPHLFLGVSTLGLLVFSVFLTTEYSKSLWDIFPPMSFLQFPWRFLNFAGFYISVLLGIGIAIIPYRNAQWFLSGVMVVLLLAINAKLFVPQTIHNTDNAFYTNDQYIRWTASKLSDEYLPKHFNRVKSVDQIVRMPMTASKDVDITAINQSSKTLSIDFSLTGKDTITIHLPPFPGWKFEINETEVIPSQKPNGYQLPLDKGNYALRGWLVQTPLAVMANFLSIVGIVFFGIITMRRKTIDQYGK